MISRSYAVANKNDPEFVNKHMWIAGKLKEMIKAGDIRSFLALESTYDFLLEKVNNGESELDKYVEEIRDFIL